MNQATHNLFLSKFYAATCERPIGDEVCITVTRPTGQISHVTLEWIKRFADYPIALARARTAQRCISTIPPPRKKQVTARVISVTDRGLLASVPHPRRTGLHFRYLFSSREIAFDPITEGATIKVTVGVDEYDKVNMVAMDRDRPISQSPANELPPATGLHDEAARAKREQAMHAAMDEEDEVIRRTREQFKQGAG